MATTRHVTGAIHIKLDELIRATEEAHNSLLNLEELSEQDIEKFRERYVRLARMARRKGIADFDVEAELEAAQDPAKA